MDFNGANQHKIIGLIGSYAHVFENQSNATLDALDARLRAFCFLASSPSRGQRDGMLRICTEPDHVVERAMI